LQLEFYSEGNSFMTVAVFQREHEGYPGIVHGGILCTALDELMVSHLYHLGYIAMTVDLQVRFKLPVPCGEKIYFQSNVENLTKRLWIMSAQAKLPSGEIALTGRAKMMKARLEKKEEVSDHAKNTNPVIVTKMPGRV